MHSEEELKQFRARQVEVLYDQSIPAVTAALTAAVVVVAILWNKVEATRLWIWLLIYLVVTGIRYFGVYRYKESEYKADRFEFWLNSYCLWAIVSGVMWGVTGYAFELGEDVIYLSFLLLCVCGLIAGSIPSYAVIHRAYYSFTLPASIMLIFYIATVPDSRLHTVAFLACFYVGFMIYIEFRTHGIIKRLIELQLDNRSLLLYLDDEKQQSEVIQRRWQQDTIKYSEIVDKLYFARQRINELEQQLNEYKKIQE